MLGIVENMSEYRCPSCGAENELFEGNTEAMCEVLDLPLLGRIPFDRTLAKTFDKGQPLASPDYQTIQKYQDIVGRIQALLDYKKVLAEKLLHTDLEGDLMKFVCLNCETYMTFQKVEKPVRAHSVCSSAVHPAKPVFDGDEPR